MIKKMSYEELKEVNKEILEENEKLRAALHLAKKAIDMYKQALEDNRDTEEKIILEAAALIKNNRRKKK